MTSNRDLVLESQNNDKEFNEEQNRDEELLLRQPPEFIEKFINSMRPENIYEKRKITKKQIIDHNLALLAQYRTRISNHDWAWYSIEPANCFWCIRCSLRVSEKVWEFNNNQGKGAEPVCWDCQQKEN